MQIPPSRRRSLSSRLQLSRVLTTGVVNRHCGPCCRDNIPQSHEYRRYHRPNHKAVETEYRHSLSSGHSHY